MTRWLTMAAAGFVVAAAALTASAPAMAAPQQPAATWAGTKCNGHPNVSYWRVCLTITGHGNVVSTAHIAAGYRPTVGFFGWTFTGFGAVYANPLNQFKPHVGPTVHQSGLGLVGTGHYNWTTTLNRKVKAGVKICATLYQVIGKTAYPRQTVCM